jgi:hypothetical protein
MHRLMQIADPMTETLQRTDLIVFVGRKRKIAHVLQDRRNHTLLRDGTRPVIEAGGITREIDIVLFGAPSRSVWPATGFGEKTVFVVTLDQCLYLLAGGGRQFLEGYLADDFMADSAPCESGYRDGKYRQKDCALDGSQHGASAWSILGEHAYPIQAWNATTQEPQVRCSLARRALTPYGHKKANDNAMNANSTK